MKKSFIFVMMFFAVLGLLVGTAVTQAAAPAPATALANLTGTWNCAVDSPSGKGNPVFVLQQNGKAITGTYKGVFGESKVTGKIEGSDFELKFKSSGMEIVYKGKVAGNKISGAVALGPYGKGTFTGEKSGEKK
ncbi:MAG: hypothetical protein ABSE95_08735 [Thermodesulfobacteriota bacterium]